jgi:hypothetical protein
MSTGNGAFTVSGRIPPRTAYGKHKILAAPASGRAYGATIEVVPAGGSRRSVVVGSLLAVWVALAAVLAGFVFSTRRRRRPVAAVAVGQELQVPLLDTWDFVPVLPGRRSRRTSPSRRRTPAKPPGATKKSKPKAAKPKASKRRKASPKTSRASTPKGSTANAKAAPKKASPTARRGGTIGGTRAPKKTAAKADPKRKPPKD